MPTRLTQVVIDSADPTRLARWWAATLGWAISYEDEDESGIAPAAGEPGIELVFVPVPEPKTSWNRIHLDLSSHSTENQAAVVDRLEAAGATRIELSVQRPWVVLADPEGNEFCVLEHREEYDGIGPLAAIVVQAADPAKLGEFWRQVARGSLEVGEQVATLKLTTPGPLLEFVPSNEPKTVKNRLHLDVRPYADDDQSAEVARLLELGAVPKDVGQSDDVTWTVLADPEGNEFCVLRPKA
jgi:predicted enzyme related to lactoylglutathione lyase